jgi:SAM-dependent methyltransferase
VNDDRQFESGQELLERVRERYAEAATRVTHGAAATCCGPGGAAEAGGTASTGGSCGDTHPVEPVAQLEIDESFGSVLYGAADRDVLPVAAVAASLGCGNPTAVAELHEGDRVLALGSGGRIDVLLSAKRVGPSGFAYGVDMTDEMLELARTNAAQAGATNVQFVKGTIEEVPLPDSSVDVVISNCVINLSVDKPKVLSEMVRVLTPGGRIGISDVVAEDRLSPAERASEATTWAASPGRCRGRSTWPDWPRSGSPTLRSNSPTKQPTACMRRRSAPSSRRDRPVARARPTGSRGGRRHRAAGHCRDRLRHRRAAAVTR